MTAEYTAVAVNELLPVNERLKSRCCAAQLPHHARHMSTHKRMWCTIRLHQLTTHSRDMVTTSDQSSSDQPSFNFPDPGSGGNDDTAHTSNQQVVAHARELYIATQPPGSVVRGIWTPNTSWRGGSTGRRGRSRRHHHLVGQSSRETVKTTTPPASPSSPAPSTLHQSSSPMTAAEVIEEQPHPATMLEVVTEETMEISSDSSQQNPPPTTVDHSPETTQLIEEANYYNTTSNHSSQKSINLDDVVEEEREEEKEEKMKTPLRSPSVSRSSPSSTIDSSSASSGELPTLHHYWTCHTHTQQSDTVFNKHKKIFLT